MHVDDVGIPILDKLVPVGSPHEYFISHIHVGASKHYSIYVKGYYIQFHLINKINTHIKFNLTLFHYFDLCILVYPSQRIWDMIQVDLGGHPPFPLNQHFKPMVVINHDIQPFDGEWNVIPSSFVNYKHHVMLS
jgi:hypothetical protein